MNGFVNVKEFTETREAFLASSDGTSYDNVVGVLLARGADQVGCCYKTIYIDSTTLVYNGLHRVLLMLSYSPC